MMTGKSFLVLGVNPQRRAYVAEVLREGGGATAEAVSLQRAQAILRQLRFDVLAIDFFGLGVGVIDFLDGLRLDHPETRAFIVSLPGEKQSSRLGARRRERRKT